MTVLTGARGKLQRLDQEYLITAKLLYFTLNLEIYAFYLYRSVFITQFLNIPLKHYGIMASVMACVSFPFMNLWGSVADRLGRHKGILGFLALATAGSFELLYFRWEEESTTQFVYTLSVLVAFSAFCSGLQPLLDVLVLKILSSNPSFNKELYGRQRMWGTLAYCVVTMVSAFLMDEIGQETLFFVMPASALIFAITLFFAVPADTPRSFRQIMQDRASKKAQKREESSDEFGKGTDVILINSVTESAQPSGTRSPILLLLTDPGYLFFLLAVFMTGLARATMTNFLALFWKKEMFLSNKKIAGAAISGVVLEVFIFFFSSSFAFLGNFWMLLLAQLSMALRCWFYAVMPENPNFYFLVLLNELFKGTAFGFTHLAGIKTAAAAAPPELQATSQAIYNSIYAQLPAIVAAFAGAQLIERYSTHTLFFVVAIISSISFLAFLGKYLVDGSIALGCFKRKRHTPVIVVEDLSGDDSPVQNDRIAFAEAGRAHKG